MNAIPDSGSVLFLVLIALAPLAPAGLALLNTGMGRSRSAAQALLGALCVAAVASIVYFAFGFSLEGYAGGPGYSIWAGPTSWDWIGSAGLFFRGVGWTGSPQSYAAAFQIVTVGLAAMIPWGSGADRWRLGSACATTVVLAGVIYPIFGHWVWGGGWLAQLGTTYQLGLGFVDLGGAATIQAVGGLTALVVVWKLGARRGKFTRNGPPAAIPAHHIVYVLLGCLLALPGWMALNLLGTMLFAGMSGASPVLTEVNTVLCAAAALLASLVVTRLRFGKPDASLCANGWIAGLVTSSAVAGLVSPGAAVFVGAVAGGGLPLAIEFLELRCRIDDPTGGISVHGLAAVWGLLAVGFLSHGLSGQFVAQLVGVATLLGLVLPAIWLLYSALDRAMPFRTHAEGERVGMDLHELGSGAYPEFALHGDEFVPR